jgi:hypothetical protein
MNKIDKRKFTSAFKVKVAMEALKGQSTIAQIAKSYDLHPTGPPGGHILDWKKTLSERSEELFATKGKKLLHHWKIMPLCMNKLGDWGSEFSEKKLGQCACQSAERWWSLDMP